MLPQKNINIKSDKLHRALERMQSVCYITGRIERGRTLAAPSAKQRANLLYLTEIKSVANIM